MKNRALTHPLCPLRTAWIQDLSSISSPKRFLSNYYSLSLKEKNTLTLIFVLLSILLFIIIQSRGLQCCLPFAFFSALPSWLLSPPSLFWISRFKINSRFYYDNVLYSRLFSNWTTLFSIHTWQLTRENLSRQFTRYTWPTNIGHFFSCKTWI